MITPKITYEDKSSSNKAFTISNANEIKTVVNSHSDEIEVLKSSESSLPTIPILTEFPQLDANKAGDQFRYNTTLWTYARENEFGTLPVGTPWPVKGYKELIFKLWVDGDVMTQVLINDIKDFTVVRENVGVFTISDPYFNKDVIVPQGYAFGTEEFISAYVNTDNNYLYTEGITISLTSNNFQLDNNVNQKATISILEFPPTT